MNKFLVSLVGTISLVGCGLENDPAVEKMPVSCALLQLIDSSKVHFNAGSIWDRKWKVYVGSTLVADECESSPIFVNGLAHHSIARNDTNQTGTIEAKYITTTSLPDTVVYSITHSASCGTSETVIGPISVNFTFYSRNLGLPECPAFENTATTHLQF